MHTSRAKKTRCWQHNAKYGLAHPQLGYLFMLDEAAGLSAEEAGEETAALEDLEFGLKAGAFFD